MSSKKQHSGGGTTFCVQEHPSGENATLHRSLCGWLPRAARQVSEVLQSQPSLSPQPGSPRLLWGPSQALKPCTDHGPSPDTLPGPGSESQPRVTASVTLSPSVVLLATVASCAGHPAPGHCLPITASKQNNYLFLYSFLSLHLLLSCSCRANPSPKYMLWLPFTLSGSLLDAQDADLN